MNNQHFDLSGRRVFVAGHHGMVGSAIVRRLAGEGCKILTADRQRVDLRDQAKVRDWYRDNRPDAVVIAAAKVGGILANDTRPAEFLHDNLAIQDNLIDGAYRHDVKKLMFLGSSCIYPRLAPQPMSEEALLSGPLEPTNEWYAVAKIAGIKQCEAYRRQYGCDYISVIPSNLYGPGDNFDLTSSHVLPALLRKLHEAKTTGAGTVTIWGSGNPLREFMHVDDLADACVFVLKTYSDLPPINIGTGDEVSIGTLAKLIGEVVGFDGSYSFDADKPDGVPRKLLDARRIHALGWRHQTPLKDGIAQTYEWFKSSPDYRRSA